jgi:hypothetical protein
LGAISKNGKMLTLLFKTPLIFAFIFLVISGRYGGKKERKIKSE